MGRAIVLPAVTSTEEIVSLSEFAGTLVRFCVALVDENGILINPDRVENFELIGDDYTDLMSANPPWAPNKPAGTYRNEDLWHFVDAIRGNKNA
jgi:hypothetical protein